MICNSPNVTRKKQLERIPKPKEIRLQKRFCWAGSAGPGHAKQPGWPHRPGGNEEKKVHILIVYILHYLFMTFVFFLASPFFLIISTLFVPSIFPSSFSALFFVSSLFIYFCFLLFFPSRSHAPLHLLSPLLSFYSSFQQYHPSTFFPPSPFSSFPQLFFFFSNWTTAKQL